MERYAKVRIPSPLPQLDKEFDYLIPDSVSELAFGQLVTVPFGSKSIKTAIVTGLSNISSFKDRLQPISEVISKHPLLTKEQLTLIEAVALRSCGSIGELIQDALPKVMKRVEANYHASSVSASGPLKKNLRRYVQTELAVDSWILQMSDRIKENLGNKQSILIVLPDYRDVARLERLLIELGLSELGINLSANQSGTSKYINYLRATSEVGVVYGNRGACFAPVKNLGEILILDDLDESHYESSAPYWNSRDVLLVRQDLEKCSLTFISRSPSTDLIRLIELGYLEKVKPQAPAPLVRVTENQTRLDDETFGLISKSLSSSKPVLIQVANLGYASALACRSCGEILKCPECNSRMWQDPYKQLRCRSCKFASHQVVCPCGSIAVKPIRTGSAGMKEWLEKAFASSHIVHSTADEAIFEVQPGNTLVIATPGAEPDVQGGYNVVLMADAANMLAFPRLKALEQASLSFANAAAKASNDGIVIYVGVQGVVAEKLRSSDFYGIVADDYFERKALGLPPEVRLCSITSLNQTDLLTFESELQKSLGNVINIIDVGKDKTIAFSYKYSDGVQISKALSDLSLRISSKSKNRKPGQRLFRICMDDWQLI